MDQTEYLRRVRLAFRADLAAPPPLTLRGANAVDGYDEPDPYDEAIDAPTDEYLERFTFWAMPYLDARSWRHYLPRLIEYALAHPTDPRMVTEALVRSLRPPDRLSPRLATLDAKQEAVIVDLLKLIAVDDRAFSARDDAIAALEEWWLPGARARAAAAAPRTVAPTTYRDVGAGPYRLTLPATLSGGGVHRVPGEHRTLETWGGVLCYDIYANVFVNLQSSAVRPWRDTVAQIERWLDPKVRTWMEVPGAQKALRLEGATYRYSPAEPERTTVVLALARSEIVSLTLRAAERPDVQAELNRVINSFAIVARVQEGQSP
ncbi:MAG: hypothetical protein JF589_07660 [Gemmatimonadetes bacterium]|nr:hypothetical protein [Gemmatimonadota bacterium]